MLYMSPQTCSCEVTFKLAGYPIIWVNLRGRSPTKSASVTEQKGNLQVTRGNETWSMGISDKPGEFYSRDKILSWEKEDHQMQSAHINDRDQMKFNLWEVRPCAIKEFTMIPLTDFSQHVPLHKTVPIMISRGCLMVVSEACSALPSNNNINNNNYLVPYIMLFTQFSLVPPDNSVI